MKFHPFSSEFFRVSSLGDFWCREDLWLKLSLHVVVTATEDEFLKNGKRFNLASRVTRQESRKQYEIRYSEVKLQNFINVILLYATRWFARRTPFAKYGNKMYQGLKITSNLLNLEEKNALFYVAKNNVFNV